MVNSIIHAEIMVLKVTKKRRKSMKTYYTITTLMHCCCCCCYNLPLGKVVHCTNSNH